MPSGTLFLPVQDQGHRHTFVKFLTISTYSGSPIAHISCKEKCTPSSGQRSLCHRGWLCKQNMGWTSAPFTPFGLAPLCSEQPAQHMQQPYTYLLKVPINLEHMLCFVIFLPLFMCFPSSELETGQNYSNCFEINPPNNPGCQAFLSSISSR